MRTIVILLLLANLSLFAYTRLDSTSGGEGGRLGGQVQPEKIRILTPQQVMALGPAKAAALADVCLEWGPFGDAERLRALADVESLALGKLLTQKRVETTSAYWVFLSPFANKAAAERRGAELRAGGHKDLIVVDTGQQRYVISLGVFRTEDAANAYLSTVTGEGISGAKAGPRQQAIAQTLLVIRDPQMPAVARLRELAGSYPGAEVKIGSCDKAG